MGPRRWRSESDFATGQSARAGAGPCRGDLGGTAKRLHGEGVSSSPIRSRFVGSGCDPDPHLTLVRQETEQLATSYEIDVFTRATAPSHDTSQMPRTAVVVAHPDDETIAMGGRIARYRDARFIHVTDGAPANGADAKANGFPSVDAYRDARRANFGTLFAPAVSSSLICTPSKSRTSRPVFASARSRAVWPQSSPNLRQKQS